MGNSTHCAVTTTLRDALGRVKQLDDPDDYGHCTFVDSGSRPAIPPWREQHPRRGPGAPG